MNRIFFTLILLSILNASGLAQTASDDQEKAGQRFISFVLKQDYEASWNAYDNSRKHLSRERFNKAMLETYEVIPNKTDGYILFSKEVDFIEENRYIVYKFRHKDEKNKKKPSYLLE